ncbi:sugar carrier protein C [Vitis vinifera]|uniref:Putative hexose transporter n=1 Tax=Vitis vinifera TaxID=29760 RepID=E3VWU2_VITVI|nr:sugar carrier protein C [Vitis vinifera]ADP37132.1 putative hexose transporter [Vitis vinifera]|eukprot:XP_002279883.3 PREDICTED: sugar carrier protein C [Vitis vinifera]
MAPLVGIKAGGFMGPSGGDHVEYPGKLTWSVLISCVLGAMGGLIFGYDIGISGGVTSMPTFLEKFFPSVYKKEELDKSTNQYCKFDSQILTLFTSSLYLAALVSSLVASYATRRFGRRVSMLVGGLIFMAGAILNAFAVNILMLIFGRILLGFGVGFATQSVPIYVSEMAPYKHRGALNNVFQLSITIGILVANVVNYFTAKIEGGWGWRVSLGGAAIPAIFISAVAWILPNTPNSMIEKGELQQAREMLCRIRGVSDREIEAEYIDLVAASEASKRVQHPWRNLRLSEYRPQLVMSILIPALQQLTGINVVMFYAPVLFQSLGFGNNASLFSAVITGLVNMLATFVAVFGTDKWGRRKLFIEGGIQMLIFQVAVAVLIALKFGVSGNVTELPEWYSIIVVMCICIYVSAFAWSWGPLGWLVPSEIFPLEIRSAAQSITVSVNMFFTFGVAEVFLSMLCGLKYGLFIFFSVFVAIMTVFIYVFLPETKGIPIEEMRVVWKRHWYWKRFMPDYDDQQVNGNSV